MSRIEEERKPFGVWLKALFGSIAFILLPPFVTLAIAPMLLMLSPVAFVVIPFLLAAFAGEAREVQPLPAARVRALKPAVS